MRWAQMLVICIVAAISGAGCGDDNSVQSRDDRLDAMPLTAGNSWFYTVTYYSSYGTVTSESSFFNRVVNDSLIGTEMWYVIESGSGRAEDTTIMRNSSEGVWGWSERCGPQLEIKYPASLHDSYAYCRDALYDTVFCEVVATSETIAVSAGTYSCVVTRDTIPRFIAEGAGDSVLTYVAPGTGLISWKGFDTDEQAGAYLSSEMVLDSVHLANGSFSRTTDVTEQ